MEFINIWEQSEYHQEVIQFWQELKALPAKVKPEDRAKELVMMAKKDGQVIGVTTSFRSQVPFLNNKCLFTFRILVHPKFRVPGLTSKLTVMTRDFLESLYLGNKTACIGMITFVENQQFIQHRNEAVWRASKLTFVGNTAEGKQIRLYYFKGARI